jgi:tRNA A37 threonylcarbamoyladenosine biosynthesis protein TsaE
MVHELEDIIDDPKVVLVVEWADVVKHVLPENKLTITIKRSGEEARELEFMYPKSLSYLVESL